MSISKLVVSPFYYGKEFAYDMNLTANNIVKYNRTIDKQVYENKYMMMVTFSNKNSRNPKLLIPFPLSFRRPKITVCLTQINQQVLELTNGWAQGQTVLYDYFSTPAPINFDNIQVSTNATLYVEWILICPIDSTDTTIVNNLYPIFDTVPNNKVTIHKYSSITIPSQQTDGQQTDGQQTDGQQTDGQQTDGQQTINQSTSQTSLNKGVIVNNKYQILVRDNGNKHPITKTVPWYEYAGYGYLDNVRYVLQYAGCKITRLFAAPFLSYNQNIYNGIPIPYSQIADYEVLFGKTMIYVLQTGKSSVIPYDVNLYDATVHNKAYLDLIQPSLHNSLYICDISQYASVKVQSAKFYNSKLYWGTVILAYSNGQLKPVLIDLTPNNTSNQSSDVDQGNDSGQHNIYTPSTNSPDEWMTAMKKYFNTHITLLFFYHITLIHEFCEYLTVIYKRCIPPSHALYHLYYAFSNQNVSAGVYDRESVKLIFPQFTFDTYEQIIDRMYLNFSYDDMVFSNYLNKYNFTDTNLQQLPEVARLQKLWIITTNYVSKYVDIVYQNADITNDKYLQTWFQQLSNTYKGFNSQLDTVTLDKVKEVFSIHIFQTLAHWSDHNMTYNMLSSPEISLGYSPSNHGRESVGDKTFANYILYIANTSKLVGDTSDYPHLMDISRIAFLENTNLRSAFYSFLHELLDFENHELGIKNYREALLLSDMYQGATY